MIVPAEGSGGPAPEPRTSGRRRLFGILARAAVSAGLLAWALHRAELREVAAALARADTALVVALLLVFPIGMAISALRWQVLLRAQGHEVPWRTLFASWIVATFVRQLLPSTLGGDAVRLWDSWRLGVARWRAVAVLGVDRLLGLFALVLLAIVGLGSDPEVAAAVPALPLWLALGAAAVAAALALPFVPGHRLAFLEHRLPRRLAGPVLEGARALGTFGGAPAALAVGLALSLLLQLHVVAFYWLAGQALGFEIPFARFLVITPIAVFVMLLPISINAIGLREGAFVFLLGLHGIDPAAAVAFAWLEVGSFLVWGAVGAVIAAVRRRGASPRRAASGMEVEHPVVR